MALQKNAFPERLFIYGEGQERNTNEFLQSQGVIDDTRRLNDMGYYPKNSPVWIADHPRAFVDHLMMTVLKNGVINSVILEDWFPSKEDKREVYLLLDQIETKLSEKELIYLKKWKMENPL